MPYKGSLNDTIVKIVGGLRQGMGYCGAQSLEELRNTAQFVKITNAALRESHPHDVQAESRRNHPTTAALGVRLRRTKAISR